MKQVGVQVEESAAQPAEAEPDLPQALLQIVEAPAEEPLDDTGFLELAVAGSAAAGEFRCADCGYGAVVQRVLPACPMCGGTVWESRAPLAPRLDD